MSEHDLAPRPLRPGRASLKRAATEQGMSERLREARVGEANRPQTARKNLTRAANWLLEGGSARATLAAMSSQTAEPVETAKQRRTRTFAYHLRRIREDHEWTQDHLAAEADVRRVQVVKWESGKDHEPSAKNLEKLCAALGVGEHELRAPIPENAT